MDVLEHMLLDPSAYPTDLPLSLLEDITGKFSDTCYIGSGGFADVYKGRLQNGMVVAVKKLKKVEIDEKQFKQEVRSLMGVKHKNIVRLLGYCAETTGRMLEFKGRIEMVEAERRRLLCFEFLPKGSLDQYITDASCGLEWHERYDIIKGICLGLDHLHMECNIVHMDLKPHNIFMDDSMVPKIGDFGTSRLVNSNKTMDTKNIMGTLGYMAPEYILERKVSKKADIFSFGVIILELLTGSRQYDLIEESSTERYTVEVVEKWMERLPNAAYSQQVSTCVLIAIECVSYDKDKRPTTECIINKLNKVESEIREKQESWSWVEGITNVTVGVVLVLILRSWVLPIVVAVIVLLCLQNPMSSWPRVVWVILFGIGAVLLTVLILMNPRAWPSVLLILKVPTALLLTILVKVAIFVRRPLWHHEADLLTLLAKVVTAAMARDQSLILLDRSRWSWMTLLFSIVSILAAVLVLLNTSPSWSWVAVARTIMEAITPMNLLAIAFVFKCVPDDLRKSRPWILFFAIEAVPATVINLVNPIISWPLLESVHRVIRVLVAFLGIAFTTTALLGISSIKSSWKPVILFAEGGLLLILLIGPITLWSWLMVDIMTRLTLFVLGLMAVVFLPLNMSASTSESGQLFLLYLVVVSLAAYYIVIIRGIMGILAIFTFVCVVHSMCEEQ